MAPSSLNMNSVAITPPKTKLVFFFRPQPFLKKVGPHPAAFEATLCPVGSVVHGATATAKV